MCGRYASSSRPEHLVEEFEVDEDRTGQASRSILATHQNPPAGQPDFNMAPSKQPFFIHRSDGAQLAMAGLYEFWRDESLPEDDPDAWLTTYTIITTGAEPELDRIHDRQPLVLERADWDDWLDPTQKDLSAVEAHLEFSRPGRFDAYPVSAAVNSTRNNGRQLLLPLARSDLVGVVDPTTGEIIGE